MCLNERKLPMSVYDFSVRTSQGEVQTLAELEGKVLLIVNTASQCGFTPQYKGLQNLYEQYNPFGFEVLAFPSNQFMRQEPGTNEEISEFCEQNYGITFPLYEKVVVNGAAAHPLFTYLKSKARGFLLSKSIKWNFTKFLVDREGNVVKRYPPTMLPEQISLDIEKLLSPK